VRVFEVMGPVMVGPSSSHTAGAARIGLLARAVLGVTPARAEVTLHGSFWATGRGHGTDRAILGGLLGIDPGDVRLRQAQELARAAGLEVTFSPGDLGEVHPNTARLKLTAADGRTAEVTASSIGGGKAVITEVDGFACHAELEHPTLLVFHADRPGEVAAVATALAEQDLNISAMQVSRLGRGGRALMVIETDRAPDERTVGRIASQPGIERVCALADLSRPSAGEEGWR
jgi:L-serine dehydratase